MDAKFCSLVPIIMIEEESTQHTQSIHMLKLNNQVMDVQIK